MVTEKRGGRRVLSISLDAFIEVCKRHDGMRRTYTAGNPLPDDARIVGGNIAWGRENTIEIILESAQWQDTRVGTPEHLLLVPQCTLHLLPEDAEGEDRDWTERLR